MHVQIYSFCSHYVYSVSCHKLCGVANRVLDCTSTGESWVVTALVGLGLCALPVVVKLGGLSSRDIYNVYQSEVLRIQYDLKIKESENS